jgi:hypothetical protein
VDKKVDQSQENDEKDIEKMVQAADSHEPGRRAGSIPLLYKGV